MTHSGKQNRQNKITLHIIVAMQAEAAFIIKQLKLKKLAEHEYDNIDIYHGLTDKYSVHLFVNQKDNGMDKIGTVHAALLTYKSIRFLKPDLILNAGTCGGIQVQSVNIFDIIHANRFIVYHDRFSGSDDKSIQQSLGFLPCADPHLLESFGLTADANLKPGVIASSNSIVVSPRNWEIIHKYHVLCIDMEAAGVAEVAQEFSIPFSAFKIVTDYVHEINPVDTLSQFVTNFHSAMDLLSGSLSTVLGVPREIRAAEPR